MRLSQPPRRKRETLEQELAPVVIDESTSKVVEPVISNDPLDEIDNNEFNDDNLFDEDLGLGDMGGGVPAMEKHSDLLKGLTNFDKYIKDKVNGWLGLVWDGKTKEYVVNPNIEPIMNGKCAAWCIDFLKTYTRDNNIITNIGREEYMNIIEDVIDVVWLNLGTRYDEFGLKNNGDIMRICVELQHSAELVLMGAGDGKYNALLTETVNRNESVTYQGTPAMGQSHYGGMTMDAQPIKKTGFLGTIKNKLLGSGQ